MGKELSRRQFLYLGAIATGAGIVGAMEVVEMFENPTKARASFLATPTIEPLKIEAVQKKIVEVEPMEIYGPFEEMQIMATRPEFAQVKDATPFVIGKYGDPKFLPENFNLRIQLKDINGNPFFMPEWLIKIAYILYNNDVPGLTKELGIFSAATLLSESGDGNYVSTGYSATIGNFACSNPNVSKQVQRARLVTIAGWLGGLSNLIAPAQEIMNNWPAGKAWTITSIDNFPSSSCGAIGPKQFLPETWVAEAQYRMSNWTKEQRTAMLNRLKDLGLVRAEVNDINQLHPMIAPEAMIMGILYMQRIKISVQGDNFSGWNQSSSQGNKVVEWYKEIKKAFDALR